MAVLRALKQGIVRLHLHYEALSKLPAIPTADQAVRSANLLLPYPLQHPRTCPIPRDVELPASAELAESGVYFGVFPDRALRLGDLDGELLRSGAQDPTGLADKPVYLAFRPAVDASRPEEKVVVKFCERDRPFAGSLANAVQRLWADHLLAPKVLDTFRLPGGTDMVLLEYLDPAEGWRGLSELWPEAGASRSRERACAWAACLAAVRAALARAHALRLTLPSPSDSGGGLLSGPVCTVHGDVRPPNIMVCPPRPGVVDPDPGAFEIRFLDFDWAGVELPEGDSRTARCPPFIARRSFPHQVVPGGLLTQLTDTATLEFCLRKAYL